MSKKTILLAFIFSINLLCSQTGYRFRNYSITNGLSQSVVTTIQQDFTHALWIGTQDGLNKFDGSKFEIFSSEDTEGLENEFILCSGKTKDGKLWFGTNNGLTQYDPFKERFKTFGVRGDAPIHIDDIYVDNYNRIWCASTTHGVMVFDPITQKFEAIKNRFELQNSSKVLALNDKEVIVYTLSNGAYVWNSVSNELKALKFEGSKDFVQVNNIIKQGKDQIFLATDQGLFQYKNAFEPLQKPFVNLEKSYGILNITDLISEEGTWYISTANKGLFTVRNDGSIFNSSQDVFQKYSLQFNEINTIFKDDFGTFWLGTERGLSNFDSKNQGFFGIGPVANLAQGLPNGSVWSFGEEASGTYLFTGTDIGVSRYNRKKGVFEHFYRKKTGPKEIQKKDVGVNNIYAINANRILVGCSDGFYELNIVSETNYSFKPLLPTLSNDPLFSMVYSIAYYKDQSFILGTKGGAVLYNLDTKEFKIFKNDPKNRKNSIIAGACRLVHRDKNGKIWLATSSGGLNYLKEKEGEITIVPYERNDILSKFTKVYISSILHTTTDEYWYGTVGSGVLIHNVKNRKTEKFDKSKGLSNNFVYGILKDRDGFIWLSTNKGLCRVDPTTKTSRNYTEIDGLMSNEMNFGAYMRGVDGRMYFGGISGFNYFDPRALSYNRPEVNVVFTKFKLEDKWLKPGEEKDLFRSSISLTDKVILSYKQRNFSLQFQASDLSNPDLIFYKYELEGGEEGEIFIGTSNEVRFNLLPYGTYTLKVYGKKGSGEWSSIPARMVIEIVPPFWFRWWFFVLIAVVMAILITYYIRYRLDAERREQVRLEMKIQERTKEIREQSKKIENQKKELEEERNKVVLQEKLLRIEKDKSEKLLNNIIPQDLAEELKKKGKANARAYRKVTIMFSDFVGFTKISDLLRPSELVQRLDFFFTRFDEIIEENNLEKIKTIGDAYMAAGGVPIRNNTNAVEACLAGLQIQQFIREVKKEAEEKGLESWDLRLGINTGEVIAGVIGSKRYAYDVWGATVNQAQRMEMLGQPGKVTITGATYKHVMPYFETTFQGKVQSKSRGVLEMFTVDRIKPELSADLEGVKPNEKFRQIFDLQMHSAISYYKAERHIMRILEKGLSPNLYYHCIEHTKDVVRAAESIAIQEGVTDEGLYLLKSAATYHDAGFVEDYDNNEPIGARMAEEVLPQYGYTPDQIEEVKRLIYVTEIPHRPATLLEEIMCDADLDYLGRDDFHQIADRLRRELKEQGKIKSDRQWDEIQVKFLTEHRFFTKTSIRNRHAKKVQNLNEIKKRLQLDKYED